jgi:hypothetical protein
MVQLYEKHWVRSGYDSTKHENLRKKQGEDILKKYYEKMYSEEETILNLEEGFTIHLGECTFGERLTELI